MKKSIALAFAAVVCTTNVNAEVLEGRVTDIVDGDEFRLTTQDQQEFHIRIAEVLSPEAEWSAQALVSLLKGETVRAATVKPLGSQEEPIRAHVYTKSVNVAYELLRLGLVQVDRNYTSDFMKLSFENEARSEGRGMWGHE